MTEITSGHHNPLITPHLEIWEWQIPAYLFLGGLVAGLMILNGVWRLMGRAGEGKAIPKTAAIWGPIFLSIGMLFLFLDLAYKLHVYRFYLTFKLLSPMSWGSWILLAVYPVQILTLALPGAFERFGGSLQFVNPIWEYVKSLARKIERTVAWANISLGVLLGLYTGVLLSVNAARPLWNTSLLAPLFLVSGLSAGAAFILLSKPSEAEHRFVMRWDIGFLVVEFFFIVLIFISLASGTAAHQHAATLFFGGAFTGSFWVLVVALGIFLPLWLEIREVVRRPVPVWLGPLLVLGGGLALRFILVMAGQMSYIPGAEMLFSGSH